MFIDSDFYKIFIRFRKKVINYLDLTLFKDLIYVNMVLGISFGLYSDNTFFTLLPMYLYEIGFPKVQACLS